jgi:RNA polymerase sigma factor (sigma-70 family)
MLQNKDYSNIDSKFIKDNEGIIRNVLNKYKWLNDYEDILQEARIWLLEAKQSYDSKKSSWVTYAMKYINWRYNNYTYYLSVNKSKSNKLAGFNLVSIDKINENDLIDDNTKNKLDESIQFNSFYEYVFNNMTCSERNKNIIKMLLSGYKQYEVAKKYGITRARIQQIYKSEINKIKVKGENMKSYKVYIAGPMKGKIDSNKIAFSNAEMYLKELGHTPINPHNLTKNLVNPTIERCMRVDLRELIQCDAIHMLEGWKDSIGASLEYSVAKAIGLKVI